MFSRMNANVKRLVDTLIELTYFLRGGLQYRDALQLTFIERQQMLEFLERRLEVEAKKTYPQY